MQYLPLMFPQHQYSTYLAQLASRARSLSELSLAPSTSPPHSSSSPPPSCSSPVPTSPINLSLPEKTISLKRPSQSSPEYPERKRYHSSSSLSPETPPRRISNSSSLIELGEEKDKDEAESYKTPVEDETGIWRNEPRKTDE